MLAILSSIQVLGAVIVHGPLHGSRVDIAPKIKVSRANGGKN